MKNERQQQTEKPIDWPAWCMALTPVASVILIFTTGITLDWKAWAIVFFSLWVVDYANLKSYGLHWSSLLAAILLPPYYLYIRAKDVGGSKQYVWVSGLVYVVIILIAIYE